MIERRVGELARLDPQGAVQWVRCLAAAGSGIAAIVTGLALDAAGNAVLCGAYANGSLPLGSFTLPANPAAARHTGVVAKLDPTGSVLWAQALADPAASLVATAAAVDAAGTAYVAVSTHGAAPYAAGMGLRSFSNSGAPGPDYSFPGVSGTAAMNPFGVFGAVLEMVVNPMTGQLGVVGDFQGTLTLRAAGTGPALAFTSPPEPRPGAFVASLLPTGAPQWALELTSTGRSLNGMTGSFLNKLPAIAPAGTGFVVAGGYLGAGNLGGTALPGSATSDNVTAVLARLDGQGGVQWTRAVSGSGLPDSGALAFAVATDAAGEVHVAGFMVGQLAADGGGLASAGGSDLLLLRYSPQGQLLGAQRDGGFLANEYPSALALDAAGQPRLAGYFTGTASIGGTVLSSAPQQKNAFVARLARTPLGARAASAAQAALQVYPNPGTTASALQVHLLPGAAPAILRLLNSLGQQVHGQAVPARAATATVPTTGLEPGRYVLQVVSAESVATRGVVVE